MNAFIDFIMGPMVWIAFLIFILGLIFKLVIIIKDVNDRESYIYSYLTLKHSLRSIFAWLIPFFPQSTKQSPVFYSISYIFHLLLFIVPIFLMSHIVLVNEAFQVSWVALDDGLADILTLVVIIALVFFAIRRYTVPEVKYLTSYKDYILILIIALPFITGFLAYHQFFLYKAMVIAHVISGEIMLILIPFSRFSHMIVAPLTRAYMGSEFGNVRHAKDW
ncbi:TmcC family electron transfer complex membrane anchor subunit [Desulfobacula sp.]|uniref:TmcC family electron transfer complex membrane anchor subunit n=1 Tax=Desulfobacula sp. TaxID=2593537 RepID=UPI0025B9C3AD|nr:nitrate reductase [Desulfobacula sp.]MBC2703546.1 nitrate reductase [Desulfobacula sp.]